MSDTIGFIGLGNQGAPIARRIVDAGFPLVLWARRPDSLQPYADTPATTAATIAELGAQCDIVGICVVNDRDVEQVCAELIPAMRAGSIITIHSTIHPDTCRALAARCSERGIHLLDAPVSGGAPAAEAGTLTVMVGGDAATLERAKPVFASFGRLITHLGDVGAGQHAKLINNTLLSAHLGIAHHALSAADALGLNHDAFVELIKLSSGRSYGFEIRARMPSPAVFGHGGALLAKDSALLGEVLPDEPGSIGLRAVADPFLSLTAEPAGASE